MALYIPYMVGSGAILIGSLGYNYLYGEDSNKDKIIEMDGLNELNGLNGLNGLNELNDDFDIINIKRDNTGNIIEEEETKSLSKSVAFVEPVAVSEPVAVEKKVFDNEIIDKEKPKKKLDEDCEFKKIEGRPADKLTKIINICNNYCGHNIRLYRNNKKTKARMQKFICEYNRIGHEAFVKKHTKHNIFIV